MKIRALLVATLLLTTLALASPAQAQRYANGNDHGKRLTVCAQSLAVRSDAGVPAFAYLHYPQTFLVQYTGRLEFGGGWVYGFAHGQVERYSWGPKRAGFFRAA